MTDLAELNLPMFDEPNHPRLHQYVHQHTKDWSAIVEASDAFVFVIPEYNYGFNAATKNAIDYLNSEWLNKPAGIVSYGGVAAGTRATQMLKQVLSALKVVVVTDSVNIPFVREKLDEDGRLKPNEIMEQAAAAMLDELARWAQALRPLRVRLLRHRDRDARVAAGAVGFRLGLDAGLGVAGLVGGPGLEHVLAGGGVPFPDPLPPAVDTGDGG